MICALTVRTLEPGTFDQFKEAFMADFDTGNPPAGWVGFDMVRNAERPDEVICFGFFDGTVDQLRAQAGAEGYQEQQDRIRPFVKEVGTDGLFEVVEHLTVARA